MGDGRFSLRNPAGGDEGEGGPALREVDETGPDMGHRRKEKDGAKASALSGRSLRRAKGPENGGL